MAVVEAVVVVEVAAEAVEGKAARATAALQRSLARVMEAREVPGAVSPSLRLRGRAT